MELAFEFLNSLLEGEHDAVPPVQELFQILIFPQQVFVRGESHRGSRVAVPVRQRRVGGPLCPARQTEGFPRHGRFVTMVSEHVLGISNRYRVGRKRR